MGEGAGQARVAAQRGFLLRGARRAGSALVLALLAAGAGTGTARAEATICRSVACVTLQTNTQETALAVLGRLLESAEGQAVLDANARATIAIYTTSSAQERAVAVLNARAPDNPAVTSFNIWNMLGGPASAPVKARAATGDLPGTIAADLRGAFSVLQIGPLKDFYAGRTDAYGIAYKAPAGLVGDPRPFLVFPQVKDAPWRTPETDAATVQGQKDQWLLLAPQPAFPSGHSMFGFTTALYFGLLAPSYYQDLFAAAQQYGKSRHVIGVHYALDVIGGRIAAMYVLAHLLAGDPDYSTDFAAALERNRAPVTALLGADAVSPIHAACGADVAACLANGRVPEAAAFRAAREAARHLLTYGLPSDGATDRAPVVPLHARELIRSRFPYLSGAELDEVLATTALPSGVPLDSGGGWARLDLHAAAGGFGAFPREVGVTLDAAQSGMSAFDIWSNDISGPGGLVKRGSGTLLLAGENSYSGATRVEEGTLAVSGALASDVSVSPGARLVSTAPGRILGGVLDNAGTLVADTLRVKGAVWLSGNSELVATIRRGGAAAVAADGPARLGGRLVLAAPDGTAPQPGDYEVVRSDGGISGSFADLAAIDGSLEARARIEGGAVIVSLAPRPGAAPTPAK